MGGGINNHGLLSSKCGHSSHILFERYSLVLALIEGRFIWKEGHTRHSFGVASFRPLAKIDSAVPFPCQA